VTLKCGLGAVQGHWNFGADQYVMYDLLLVCTCN